MQKVTLQIHTEPAASPLRALHFAVLAMAQVAAAELTALIVPLVLISVQRWRQASREAPEVTLPLGFSLSDFGGLDQHRFGS